MFPSPFPSPPDRYMFDEPSSYLDVKQRLRAALAIRNLLSADRCAYELMAELL